MEKAPTIAYKFLRTKLFKVSVTGVQGKKEKKTWWSSETIQNEKSQICQLWILKFLNFTENNSVNFGRLTGCGFVECKTQFSFILILIQAKTWKEANRLITFKIKRKEKNTNCFVSMKIYFVWTKRLFHLTNFHGINCKKKKMEA